MFNKIKEKKGWFTLVELIIVLVILAVLAAFLVPTLTGYVDKADEKSLISEARLAVMAAQTVADEEYAIDRTIATNDFSAEGNTLMSRVMELSELEDGTVSNIEVEENGSKITKLQYKPDGSTKYVQYDSSKDSAGKYEVVKTKSN